MSKRTRSLIVIVLVAAGLAYPCIAWLIGMQTEALLAKREQQTMDRYGASLRLISRQYHRGIFDATEQLTYGFTAPAVRLLGAMPGAAAIGAMHLVVHNSIHHGPLPQGRTIALATVDTQLVLPPELSTNLHTLLGGVPAVTIHTRLGWLGGTTTAIGSPDYRGRLADGTEINWHDVDFKGSASRNLSSVSSDATAAAIGLRSDKSQVELNGLQFHAALDRAFDVLYTGPLRLKIARLQWQSPPSNRHFFLQGLSIGVSSTLDGDYYDSSVDLTADALQLAGVAVTRAGYDVSLEHLHGPTLAALVRAMREAQQGGGPAVAFTPSLLQGAVKQDGIELLVRAPVLDISRIGFAMPEGEFRLSGKLSLPGLRRKDLEGPQAQVALVQHLDIVADIRIDAALANRLLAYSGRTDVLAPQLDALERQGYIKRDGGALTMHLAASGGRITVNGLPYPPMPPR